MTLKSALLPALALAAACSKATTPPAEEVNTQPAAVPGALVTTTYDGTSNDLLTGGLGKSGLAGAAPAFADPLHPTAAELRTRAIYNNYRALVDTSANGGYGTLYGPNVDASGTAVAGEGKIAGDETLAYADDGTGAQNVTVMVQVPSTFDPAKACIVTAVSSGSRGVYGAIGTAGEWGLKHGCAVAYSDKGTGNGAHNLSANTVSVRTGERKDAAAAGADSNFTAKLSAADLAAFNAATPNRFAFKHAHSQLNPEKDWGTHTLQAIQLAYYVLNQKFGALAADKTRHLRTLTSANTIVIASSASNGAGASLAAAEQDTAGLIGGVVAGEPQVQLAPNAGKVQRSGAVATSGKSLFDYVTIAALYQPCAARAAGQFATVVPVGAGSDNRCAGLAAKGLLTSATVADQATESLARLRAAGWDAAGDPLQGSHYLLGATLAVAVTYANTYGKFSVTDNLCGYSFSSVDSTGKPAPLAAANEARFFSDGNGIPSTNGAQLIQNNSEGGAVRYELAVSPSTHKADYDLDGALCLRGLATGTDAVTGAALTGAALANSQRVQAGVAAVQRSGNLHGKPTILVQGRSDTLVPINHASRAYYAANKAIEGAASQVVIYEVTNAQHFDAFLPFPSYAAALVPLHRYFIQSMDLMYAHLKSGAALPPSQVVRTTPRGSASTAITATNVPPIATAPAAADQITVTGTTVVIPD